MSSLLKVLGKITGNGQLQKALEFNVRASHYLMGIGAGSDVSESGEKAVFRLLGTMAGAPFCIFDVGANKGQFLELALAQLPTEPFAIHCFEPGHVTFKLLQSAAGDDRRVHLNNMGLGKERGMAILHFDEAGSGIASLTKRRLDHFKIQFDKTEEIEIQTIDEYCGTNGIDHIHLLKIDIEGHELDALHGAKGMFQKGAIDIVTFEFGGANIDTRTFFQDFWYFFAEFKMRIFRITPSGYLHVLSSYKEIFEQFRTANYVAVRAVS
jgi:FkbM family methyltransferase